MPTRAEIVEEAKSWASTPWAHQQSIKGVGCDCVGFIAGVARNTGAVPDVEFEADYHRAETGERMVQLFRQYMNPIEWTDALPADVFVLRFSESHWHCMIVTEREGDEFRVVEAERNEPNYKGGVVIHRIDGSHKRRIHSAYRLRTLTGD